MAVFEIHCVDEQIKALPTIKTASGSIAIFQTDMTENLISCIAEIVAQQASGTPTPTNPLPISGFSSLNLIRCGKNFIKPYSNSYLTSGISIVYSNNSVTITGSTSSTINAPTSGTIRSINGFTKLQAGTYTAILSEEVSNISIVVVNANTGSALGSGSKYITFTINSETDIFLRVSVASGFSNPDGVTVGLCLVEGNSTTYEPYNGNTFTVSFGQTVYGGYIDVVTGKLVITHGFKIFNGSESWNKHGTIPSWFYVDNAITDGYMNNGENDFQICNFGIQTRYTDVLSLQNGHFVYGSANKRFIFKNTDYTEVADFQTWLSNNNMQVAYKLDTPIELDVSSVAIPTLSGTNNIYADTGDIDEVKYILSVGEYLRQA